MTPPIVVAALYKFVTLEDYVELREPLLKAMLDNGIKGTLLIAEEGINGTVSGTREGIDGLMAWLKNDPRMDDIDHKESYCDEQPFYRTKVKLRKKSYPTAWTAWTRTSGLAPMSSRKTGTP
jgi:UPF0176 protein